MAELDYKLAAANWRYEPETGLIYWLRQKPKVPRSLIAGAKHSDGSIKIGLAGKRYYAHRIAWVLMTGRTAPDLIDHINGHPSDNRWSNLRCADQTSNQANLKQLPKGVVERPYGRFEANIRINGRKRYLGVFSSAVEAASAYARAHIKAHGEFSCFNRPLAVAMKGA